MKIGDEVLMYNSSRTIGVRVVKSISKHSFTLEDTQGKFDLKSKGEHLYLDWESRRYVKEVTEDDIRYLERRGCK